MQGQQGVGRGVTTSQPNMVPLLQQHPHPAVMYPVQGYPLQQYPQPIIGYPPPYVASAPQLQMAPPAVVGYPNPAFAPDWQGYKIHTEEITTEHSGHHGISNKIITQGN